MKVELVAVTPDAESIIENAGRTCYQSQDKAENEPGRLIRALIKSGHDSVLEHASATFRVNGCSRAMTHQVVRHRLCSFSQQSQRYVKEAQFDYVVPPAIKEMDIYVVHGGPINGSADFKKDMEAIQGMYNKWKARGLKNEDARFVLPNACCSEIVISANFRQWRKVFELRCDKHAQWEIRGMATDMLKTLNDIAPNVFKDLAEKFI